MSGQSTGFSRWRIEGTCGEVADVLGEPLTLARWWPSVFLAVEETTPPDARGAGRRARVDTKGWVPCTQTWEFEVTEARYPFGFTMVAVGAADAQGVWTFEQDGAFVNVTCEWRWRAHSPLLRTLWFLLKPVVDANHRWAMAQGETSLELELARRRATSEAARARVPPAPGPVTYAAVGLIAAAVAVGVGLSYLMVRARRRSG